MPLLSETESKFQTVGPTTAAVGAGLSSPLVAEPESPEFAYENLSSLTRLGRSFSRGPLVHERGQLGSQLRRQEDPVVRERLRKLEERLTAVGEDGPGFTGFLGPAAEVAGQMAETLADPQAPAMTAAGAVTFGSIGALAGPGAPVGAGVGAAVGLTAHMAMDTFEVEAGNSYVDQVEAGIDPNVAYWTSAGVGAVNTALELTGLALIAKPFNKLIRGSVRKAFQKDTVVAAAKNAAAAYGVAVAGETTTEILQEAMAIAAEEVGKSLTSEDLERMTPEEIVDRLAEIGEKTLKAMTVLAAPGAGASFIADRKRARAATANRVKLDAFKEKVDELQPDVKQAQTVTALEQADVKEVFISAESLVRAATDSGDPAAFYSKLGMDGAAVTSLEDAMTLGGDAKIDSVMLSNLITNDDLFKGLADHVRFDADGASAAEAKELEELKQEELEEPAAIPELKPIPENWTVERLDEYEAGFMIKNTNPNNPRFVLRDESGNEVFRMDLMRGSGELEPGGNVTRVRLPDNAFGISFVERRSQDDAAKGLGPAFYNKVAQMLAESGDQLLIGVDASERAQNVARKLEKAGLSERVPIEQPYGRTPNQIQKVLPTLAEAEMGLQALFATAKDAGMTDKQYEAYLVNVQKAADSKNAAQERIALRAELREQKKEIAELKAELGEIARESVGNQPVYQALNGIGRERLDRAGLVSTLPDGEEQLKQLPKLNGRQIYTSRGESGIDPSVYAELYGFDGPDIMAFAIMDAKPFEEAIAEETERLFTERFSGKEQRAKALEDEIEALHNDGQATVLAAELNALRVAAEQGRVKPRLVKLAARDRLRDFKLKDISPKVFLRNERRAAKQAARLLRKGDRVGASRAKFQQLVNFHLALESFKVVPKTKGQRKFFEKFLKRPKPGAALPVDFRNIIVSMLGVINLKRPTTLKEIITQKQIADGVVIAIQAELVETIGKRHYLDLTLREWEILHEEVTNVQKQGLDENRFFREWDKKNRQETVDEVVASVRQNVKNNVGEVTETAWENLRDTARKLRTFVYTMDTIVKNLDGFDKNFDRINGPAVKIGERVFSATNATHQHAMKKAIKALGPIAEQAIENDPEGTMGFLTDKGIFVSMSVGLERRAVFTSPSRTVYNALKKPYDDAMSRGYIPNVQKGYLHRQKAESEELLKLFDIFNKSEQVNMTTKVVVPGVGKISHQRQLAAILNLGNLENRLALTESKQFTDVQLNALVANMNEKDFKFVQGVWDYLEKFWPEVVQSSKRRRNVDPQKVEATPVDTPHGTLRGGYYPLHYDAQGANMVLAPESNDVQQVLELMRFGQFTSMMTKHGHAKFRVGSAGRNVRLDLFVLNSHVNQVVYDLEMGDALIDIYKVLYHRDTQKVFQEMGQHHKLEQMQLWFANAVMGEMHHGAALEKTFRYLRTGFVIPKLAFSATTAFMQTTGVFQSAVLIGKYNMLQGVMSTIMHPGSFKFVREVSPFMATRQFSFNREIIEAQQALKSGWIRKMTYKESSRFIAGLGFYGIIKMQAFVDVSTWLGAHRQGMQLFNGDYAKAVEHADRSVTRAQASGIFGDRTPLERGSFSKQVQQTEAVRSLVPLMGYFLAKTNIAYERVKSTDFKNPIQIADLVVDITLLYMVDALVAAWVYGNIPEEPEDLPFFFVAEMLASVFGGVPFVKDAVSEASGFKGGGTQANIAAEAGRFFIQTGQILDPMLKGEDWEEQVDAAFVKSALRFGGTLGRVPGTSQTIRTGETEFKRQQGEDIGAMDYVFGSNWRD